LFRVESRTGDWMVRLYENSTIGEKVH
jgi:hypothetical protein